MVLEEIAAELATGRLTDADAAVLRSLAADELNGTVTDHRALHGRLAAITRNAGHRALRRHPQPSRVPVLPRRTIVGGGNDQRIPTGPCPHRRRSVGGRRPQARRRMRRHLEAESTYLQNRHVSRQFMPRSVALGGGVSNKRAEDVARAVLQDVVADDLEPGTFLGSQTELIERYGASRAVFREALRLLEHHQIATMRRGPGGGLFVAVPSVRGVSEVVAVYLTKPGHLHGRPRGTAHPGRARGRSIWQSIGLTWTARPTCRWRCGHEEAMSMADFADGGHNLHAVIASLAGNRALELVALVLIRLMRLHQVEAVTDEDRRPRCRRRLACPRRHLRGDRQRRR